MYIAFTRYTEGKVPFHPLMDSHLSIYDTMMDMFRRLLAGAEMAVSGYNYGLVTYIGPRETPTGSDTVSYGGLSSQLQDFIILATKWWEHDKAMELGSSAHEQFIRWRLIQGLDLQLSEAEMSVALGIAQDEFLRAISMGLETGENVAVLFVPSPAAS